mmetsp:Transcript_1731/g.3499  ORF Transcript_1731/g.3499 Transcript_1731/m.3499 type:complete len:525 (+) Transcript_1731:215-1789(+)
MSNERRTPNDNVATNNEVVDVSAGTPFVPTIPGLTKEFHVGNNDNNNDAASPNNRDYASPSMPSDGNISLYPSPSEDTYARINRAMERNDYRDFSHLQKYEVTREASMLKKQQSFPMKLHKILACKDYDHVVTWLPHGRAWKVLNDDMLVDQVLGRFFNHKSRASFLRQVNNWNFKRILTGPDEGAYYNEKFLRGLPHVSFLMKQSQARRGKSKPKESEAAVDFKNKKSSDHPIFARMLDIPPDFYTISQVHPLPEACALSNSFTATPGTDIATAPPPLPSYSAAVFVSAESSSDYSYLGRLSKKAPDVNSKKTDSHKPVTSNQDAKQGNEVRGGQVSTIANNLSNSHSVGGAIINADGSGNVLPSAGVIFGGHVPMQLPFLGNPFVSPPVVSSSQPQDHGQQQIMSVFNPFAQSIPMGQTLSNPAAQPQSFAPHPQMSFIDPTAMAFLQRMFVQSNYSLVPVPFQQSMQSVMPFSQTVANAAMPPSASSNIAVPLQQQNLQALNVNRSQQQQPPQHPPPSAPH